MPITRAVILALSVRKTCRAQPWPEPEIGLGNPPSECPVFPGGGDRWRATAPQVELCSMHLWPRPKPMASALFGCHSRNSHSRTKAGCPSESQESQHSSLNVAVLNGSGNTEHRGVSWGCEEDPEEAAQSGTRPLPGAKNPRIHFTLCLIT